MVQRLSVLLTSTLIGTFGPACAPETLRIHVPSTGVESVHQEDLRRAYWRLERGDDPMQWWLHRASQFHFQSSSSACHSYQGQSDGVAVVYAQPTPMQLTVMGSLAKALDRTTPSFSWQFCLVESTLPAHDTVYKAVIDLNDDFPISPSFVEVNFEILVRDVQEIVRAHMQ